MAPRWPTNALLERRGARTALVTTEGFRDVIEIGRQDRPSLYDLTERPASPLVPRELRFTVTERIGPHGVEIELDEDSVRRAAEAVAEADVDAVAVCLLFSFADPSHEQRVRDVVREVSPNARCSLSSDVLPEFREYERFSTTTADAYLRPALAAYLELLGIRLRERGLPEPLVMQSSGGVVDLAAAWSGRPPACSPGLPEASSRRRSSRRKAVTSTSSPSTWAARALMSRSCCVARFRRRRARSSAASRSSTRWSTSTRSAPAAARLPGSTTAARCASARARRARDPGPHATAWAATRSRLPTPTSTSATSRTARRSAGRSSCDASPPSARSSVSRPNSGLEPWSPRTV